MKIAVLIPCYNEELTIKKVINDFKKELPQANIYVYDNNSSDNTYNIAKKEGAIVIKEQRQGKGNVVRSMFRDIDADIYVMVDGDDTYPANEVHKLIEPITNNEADMVIGDRLSNGTYGNENKRKFHGLGNNLVKWLVNSLYKSNIQDMMTGYRVFNKFFVKTMPVLSKKFEIETEMSLHSLDKNLKIKEIPITYRDRPEGSTSKLNTFKDGYRVLKMLFQIAKDYKPLFVFGIISLISLMFALVLGIPVIVEYMRIGTVPRLPTALLSTGFVIISVLMFITGIILNTIVNNSRRNYELQINILLESIKSEKVNNN